MAPKKAGKTPAAKKEETAKAEAPKVEAPKAAGVQQKRKADEEAVEAPEVKEAKTEEVAEQEQDAKQDSRPGIKGDVGFNTMDTTLNLVPTMGGRVLASLTEGAMQSLIAAGRANIGLKTGRYMFDVRILEVLGGAGGGKGGKGGDRHTLRIGFSTASAHLVLGAETEESVYFDADGGFFVGSKKLSQTKKCHRGETLALVLNLDAKSPNKNTVSLFANGVRVSKPQALPEGLIGKPLFPHVAFRSIKVRVNWGPEPLKALPFKCRTVGSAAQADTVVGAKADPKDGKYDVVMPVGFPDEGTFDWADEFLSSHPNFTELSDRMIVEWAQASGFGSAKAWKASNDRSDIKLGSGAGDATRVLRTFAGLVPRNYMVMEMKENLIAADRQAILRSFALPCYKKVAHVMMGDPKPEFKRNQQAQYLKFKQEKAEVAWKASKAQKRAKKAQKEAGEKRKKADEDRKKKMEEQKKKSEEKKEEEKKEGDMEVDEGKKEEVKEEAKNEEAEPKAAESDSDDDCPAVELTDEDRAKVFAPKACPDLKPDVFSRNFSKFALPDKAEGFDDIKYEWQPAAAAGRYLQSRLQELKKSTRIEDLNPGQWFRDTSKSFNQKLTAWQAKQKAYKESEKGKAEAATRKKAEEKGEATLDDTADGEIFSSADVTDIDGAPLFKDFVFEDWAMFNLRCELFVLHHAFQKDVNDADRPGIPDNHFAFYYNKYYKKGLNFKAFGVENLPSLVKLVKDTMTLEGDMLGVALECEGDDIDTLLKQTELGRRERQRRLYAGDETARLKLTPEALKAASTAVGVTKPQAKAAPAAAKAVPAKLAVAKPAGVGPAKAGAAAVTKPGLAGLTKPVIAKPGGAAPAITKPGAVTAPTIKKPVGVTAPTV